MAGDYTEGEEIQQLWHTEVLWWSWLISAMGAYVAFTTTSYIKRVRNTRWYWPFLTQAGLALGVCAVWAMHFVGMRALVLKTDGKPQVVIGFEPLFSIVSALAAWLICCIALHMIIGQEKASAWDEAPPMMGKTMTNASSMRSSESVTVAMVRTLKALPRIRLFFAASLVAMGVVIMHYMGMLSQSGRFTMQFRAFPIAASMFLAGFAASVTLPIFAFDFDGAMWRLLCAAGVGVCVNGMHYTGMSSGIYFYHHRHTGVFGESTIAWRFYYKDVVAFALILNLVLMGVAGFYVEVARELIKQEENQIEERLQFEVYKKQTKGLIKRSRIMRYPMSLVRYSTFADMKKLRPHEELKDERKLLFLDTVKDIERTKKDHVIVFFSHQWLDHGYPDPQRKHYSTMMKALYQLAKALGAPLSAFLIFVDYCSIPQDGPWVQQLAIDSLATYVALSTSIVIVAPQAEHRHTHALCGFGTYSDRFWCRLEIFCTVLSSLRENRHTMFNGGASGGDTDTTSNKRLHGGSHPSGNGSTSPAAHNPNGGGTPEECHDLIVLDDEEGVTHRDSYELYGMLYGSELHSVTSRTLPVRPAASAASHLFSSSMSDNMEAETQEASEAAISRKRSDRTERSFKSDASSRSGRSSSIRSLTMAGQSSAPSGISPVVLGKASEVHPQPSEPSSSAITGLTMRKASKTKRRRTGSESLGLDTMDSEEKSSLTERQRVFLIQGTGLTRVHFFGKDGQLRKKFEHLTDVYGGRTSCCDLGHPWGPEACDRHRVVESLCGAYGGMLQDLRRLQRRSRSGKSKSAGDIRNDGRVKLVEEMIKKRKKIFPERYFSTRIDAVHDYFKTHENTRRNLLSEDHDASAAETPAESMVRGSDTEPEELEPVVLFESKDSKDDDTDSSAESSESDAVDDELSGPGEIESVGAHRS